MNHALVMQRLPHVKPAISILEWAQASLRDLAWRKTRDPWAILVAEVMLQQTQVPRVVPRWSTFLHRFPTPTACAEAGRGAVVREWAGLGYNRRAVALWRAATAIVEQHGGSVPRSLAQLLALPGVGPYTARAVLAFAYEDEVAVLDTNARRVLARLLGRPVGQAAADALVPPGAGWAWNQAILDLGATVCRSRPGCSACPASAGCAWRVAGGADPWRPGPRQGAFAGSDRQGRGRIVAALRARPVPLADVAAAAGWPDDADRAARVVGALIAEGVATRIAGTLALRE